jgi:ubiquinol-cytochrome c reductase cytochrome b subunit
MHLFRAIGNWFDHRVGGRATLEPMITHPVPRTMASWWYVFGSATLMLFVIQIVTGICLALVYVPAADKAY